MPNNRIFWPVQAAGFAQDGTQTFTTIHGLQSIGVTTSFNLEQIFELGQAAVYENIEELPDVEATVEKVIDGYPLLYHLATPAATASHLIGRSDEKAILAMSIFDDTQENASGTPLAEIQMSGMYISSLNYTFPVDGNCTESVTLVGNNKVWAGGGSSVFNGVLFDGTDSPNVAVQRRQDVSYTYSYAGTDANGQITGDGTILPPDIEGVTSSGEVTTDANGNHSASVQSISVSADLGRTPLNELGQKGPYFRPIEIPVEVTTDIEIISKSGDFFDVQEDADNTSDRSIQVELADSTKLNMGTKNRLSNISIDGGGTDGGNVSTTYTYTTQNDLTVTHDQDPAGL